METITENTPATVQLNQEQKAIAEQKKVLWGDLGVEIYEKELVLQVKAQHSLAKLKKIPTTIEDVIEAEKTLKIVKQEAADIQVERKFITSKFDKVSARLMEPEKSFIEPLNGFSNAIISIKKAEEQKQLAERAKTEQLAKCREFLTITRHNADAGFRNKILEKVNKAYVYALGDANVQNAELEEFFKLVLSKVSDVDFKIQYPLNSFPLVPTDVFVKMCNELLMVDSKPYLGDYENQLRAKFSDYEVALHNKEQAIASAAAATAAQQEIIKAETANANTAAKLNSIAVDAMPIAGNNVKALKQSYEVDMIENLQNSVLVMGAFVANIGIAASKLKVNKWDSFTIGQMKNALGKCKCDDNAFAPAGIIFKTVDKL